MASLSLGTASFGTAYGVANDGHPTELEVRDILAACEQVGVRYLDTAPAYGCDRLIARYARGIPFRVVTKTPDGEGFCRDLAALGLRYVHALLLHDPGNLEAWPEVARLKAEGRTTKIGVSCYTEDDIGRAMELDPRPDIIQAPVSVLDGRLWRVLPELHEQGVEIHARSVFLQGLILMDSDNLPAFAQPAEAQLRRFRRSCGKRGISLVEGALGYVLGLDFVDLVVVGVVSAAQLREAAAVAPLHFNQEFCVQDETVLDPRRWPA